MHPLMLNYSFVLFGRQVHDMCFAFFLLLDTNFTNCVLVISQRLYMVGAYAAYLYAMVALVSHCNLQKTRRRCACIAQPLVIWHMLYVVIAQGISNLSKLVPTSYDIQEVLSEESPSKLFNYFALMAEGGIKWSKTNISAQKWCIWCTFGFYIFKLLSFLLFFSICIAFVLYLYISESYR